MIINCKRIRFYYVFVTIFFSFIYTANTKKLLNCKCGMANKAVSTRIVGGKITEPHIYPWIAAVYNASELDCGGVLINDRYVLTAGHCVRWSNDEDLSVILGLHDRSAKEGLHIKIERSILHENFEIHDIYDSNDIALLKLPFSVPFSKTIAPVCLPHPLSDYSNREAVVAGWGSEAKGLPNSRFLQETRVTVLPHNRCLQTPLRPYIENTMLCAYALGKDACEGDSGGPLTFEREPSEFTLIGIISWSIDCATTGVPGVYAHVQKYLDWIQAHTPDGRYCADN